MVPIIMNKIVKPIIEDVESQTSTSSISKTSSDKSKDGAGPAKDGIKSFREMASDSNTDKLTAEFGMTPTNCLTPEKLPSTPKHSLRRLSKFARMRSLDS